VLPARWRCRPLTPSARYRVPPMPSADFCGAVREDSYATSPVPGHPTDLPRSAIIPSVHRRRMYQAQSACGWRPLLLRASSPRRYHTSYPVRVPRPTRAFHAAFRRPLARTPSRFPGPSAPGTPGRGTFTPEHDRMHGTHAPSSTARRIMAHPVERVVRRGAHMLLLASPPKETALTC